MVQGLSAIVMVEGASQRFVLRLPSGIWVNVPDRSMSPR